MGAAWRDLKDRDMPKVAAMISGVKALGLETCATLGMLTADQAKSLREAGLDYYNHNLDTSPEYYASVVTTRTYQDRLDTLSHVRAAGMSTCCGGIVGMGESRNDRAGLLHQLAILPEHPDSLPVNALVPVGGTPLGDQIKADGECAARAILDHHLLAQLRPELGGDDARDGVGCAARRLRHDEADGAIRVLALRIGRAGQQ
jgi:biotin synthase